MSDQGRNSTQSTHPEWADALDDRGVLRAKVWPASNPAMKRVFSDPPR